MQNKPIEINESIFIDWSVHDEDGFMLDVSNCIDNSDVHNFIIRLYRDKRDKDDNSWIGSGAIVGHYLVTVAHVMIDKKTGDFLSHLYYKHGECTSDEYYEITENDLLYDGRTGLNDDVDNIHHDLLIFKLPEPSSSPFIFNDSDFEIPLEVYARSDGGYKYGYSYCRHEVIDKKGIDYKETKSGKYIPVEWDNCLLTTGNFSQGNSGTPIYRQETIYGLLIGYIRPPNDPTKVLYNFIDARYISEKIAEIEKGKMNH